MTASEVPSKEGVAGNAGRLGTILIADHEVETRSLAAAVLQKAGYDVVEVDSGNDVIDAARLELPRLVILEVTLPALSGYEVCHQLREEFGEGLPIILVSGERTEPFDRAAISGRIGHSSLGHRASLRCSPRPVQGTRSGHRCQCRPTALAARRRSSWCSRHGRAQDRGFPGSGSWPAV